MRLSLYSVAAVLVLFVMAYSTRPTPLHSRAQSDVAAGTMEAAYRDGLYLGRLHRKQGLRSHAAVGRWSREADRRLFTEGYIRGYRPSPE